MLLLDETVYIRLEKHPLIVVRSEGFSPIQVDELIPLACATAGRNLTAYEWYQFMGDIPYQKTCAELPG